MSTKSKLEANKKSSAIPSNMQPGEYLFLEKRRNKKWLKQMYISCILH